MLVVIYEGDPGDPLAQTMRLVRAESVEAAREAHPQAVMVQRYVKPVRQDEIDLRKLRRGMPVWRF